MSGKPKETISGRLCEWKTCVKIYSKYSIYKAPKFPARLRTQLWSVENKVVWGNGFLLSRSCSSTSGRILLQSLNNMKTWNLLLFGKMCFKVFHGISSSCCREEHPCNTLIIFTWHLSHISWKGYPVLSNQPTACCPMLAQMIEFRITRWPTCHQGIVMLVSNPPKPTNHKTSAAYEFTCSALMFWC